MNKKIASWFKFMATACAVCSCLFLTVPILHAADDYPTDPIKLIAGAAVGGANDTYARVLASFATDHFKGQPMVVINKEGGAQVIAMKAIREAKPDGYTLGSISAGSAVLTTMMRDQGVAFPDDFEIVAEYGRVTPGLFVKKDGPFKTIQDVIDAAKKDPGKLRWGHSGRGTAVHVACLGWLKANGLEMKDVPFKGGAQSRAALISGDLDLVSTGVQQVQGFEEKVVVLGAFSDERDPLMDQIPTMKEQNIASVDVYSPMMVIAPKETSPEIIQYVEKNIERIVATEKFQQTAKNSGISVDFKSSEQAKARIAKLIKAWKPIMDEIKSQE